MKKKGIRKWMIFAGVGVLAAAAVLLLVRSRLQVRAQSNTPGSYQTQAATRGDIAASVGATGNIRTNQSVVLNWQTTGIISKIDVKLGQTVKAGDVLGELDPASLPQSILSAQNNLAADQKALDDLLNSGVARANAQVALIQAQQALQTAQKTAQSKQFQRASQETIDIAKANLIQAQDALDKASGIYNNNKNRDQNDSQYAAALSQYANAQQKFDQAQLNLDYVQGMPDPLDVQLANANLELAQANLLDAQRAWNRLKDGPNPTDVAAAQAKVAADQATINMSKVTAPIGGTITVISGQQGDLVTGSSAGFQIDDVSHMYVDISVSEVDIDKVQIGQPVALTYDAVANKTYQGKVASISNVGALSSGVVNYTVTVELLNRDPAIKAGMTASAEITVPGATNAILIPSRAVRTVNSRQEVYVMRNGAPTPVPVTLGATSVTDSEVTNGTIREGDLIVLNPPSSTTTQAGAGGILGRLFGGGARVPAGGGGYAGGGGNFNGGNGGNNRGGSGGANSGGGGNRIIFGGGG
jgi:HlyD family secretion protein